MDARYQYTFKQGPDAPCFEQLKATYLRALPKQQALLDVLLQLIKTWPLTIGPWRKQEKTNLTCTFPLQVVIYVCSFGCHSIFQITGSKKLVLAFFHVHEGKYFFPFLLSYSLFRFVFLVRILQGTFFSSHLNKVPLLASHEFKKVSIIQEV